MKSGHYGDGLTRLPIPEGPESDPTPRDGVRRLTPRRPLCAYRKLRHGSSFTIGVEMQ